MKERPQTLWLLAALAVIGALIAFADREIVLWATGLDNPLVRALRDITQIGNARWYLFGLPIVIIVALGLRRRAGGGAALALEGVVAGVGYAFLSVALSGIVTNLVKLLVGRARPVLLAQDGSYGLSPFSFDHNWQSFPSGHTTTLFALAGALGCLAPRWRIPAYAAAALLSASRVAVGAHYPSDLVAGAVVGIASALLLRSFLADRGLVFRRAGDRQFTLVHPIAGLWASFRRS